MVLRTPRYTLFVRSEGKIWHIYYRHDIHKVHPTEYLPQPLLTTLRKGTRLRVNIECSALVSAASHHPRIPAGYGTVTLENINLNSR